MEITLAIIISIISVIMTILNLAFNRKDKSNKDTKDESYHLGQIDTKLKNIEYCLTKIEHKLDTYDEEIDLKIEKAMKFHIKEYHKGA